MSHLNRTWKSLLYVAMVGFTLFFIISAVKGGKPVVDKAHGKSATAVELAIEKLK